MPIGVASGQIPRACALTSASLPDSQVAISLMAVTSARVSCRYDLMDSAHDDAAAIVAQSEAVRYFLLQTTAKGNKLGPAKAWI